MSRSVPESTTDCVKVLDLEGNLLSINARGCQLLEIDDPKPYIGHSWIELWGGIDKHSALACVLRASRGEEARFEGFATTLRGTPRWWSTVISPLPEADGTTRRLLAVSEDITARVRQRQGKAQTSASGAELAILVVEDREDARDMLVLMLEMMGYRVKGAATGAQALALAAEEPRDAIIVDIGLPDVNGLTLAGLLRERIASQVALLALSGYAQEDDRRRSMEAGFDVHLVKPIDPAELARAIESIVSKRRANATA